MSQNPLSQFFRQPAIYIKLPSNGAGWVPGSLDLPANGELPVLPMTAIDEITYRTPDALFNGEAVVSVIKSCITNIKDPWSIPSVDIDTILIGIRIASYGNDIDVDSICPNCETEHSFSLDLSRLLDQLGKVTFDQPLVINDLTIYFKPLNYREITNNSLEQYEYQRTLQNVSSAENINEKSRVDQLNSVMKKLIEVTVKALTNSIVEIRTPQARVSDRNHIAEFLANCDKDMFNKIKDFVIGLREQSELKPLSVACPNCSHKYEQAFTLDMANFFGPDS